MRRILEVFLPVDVGKDETCVQFLATVDNDESLAVRKVKLYPLDGGEPKRIEIGEGLRMVAKRLRVSLSEADDYVMSRVEDALWCRDE